MGERNIASSRPDYVEPGRNFIDIIQQEIGKADFICAVLPAGYSPDNVLLDIGVAVGLKRPVVVLIEPETKIPFDLRNLNYVTVRVSDRESLRNALDSLIASLLQAPQERRLSRFRRLKNLSSSDSKKVFDRLKDPHKVSEAVLLKIVTEVFRKTGALLFPSPAPDRGVDLSIWIDELQPIFGNPILVEVKAGRLDQSQIDDAYHYLSYHLIRSNLLLGIVVYWDSEGKKFKIPIPSLPLVACFSIQELVDHLQRGSFTKALLTIRNKAAHGMVS